MKNIFTFGTILALVATPAFAETSHTESTFPQNGQMQEDTTYTNQANVTNMKVSSGNATTTAVYLDCPSGWDTSDEGATSTDYCYKACTVADLSDAHAATASGKNYYGQSVTDTCAIASCNEGYTLNPGNPDLTTAIGVTQAGTASAYIDNSGSASGTTSDYGITANNTFGVDYGTGKGKITGKALCSTQVGDNQSYAWTNPTTNTTMTPEFGVQGAQYCYCQLDSYTSPSGATQSLSAPWVFLHDGNSASRCASICADDCANNLLYGSASNLAFRAAMFNAAAPSAPSCDANVITITWDHADAADITANNAGSVTYGGDIRTPKKAQHISGKIFVGWTFNTPQQ